MRELDVDTLTFLHRYHFDEARFVRQQALLKKRSFTPAMAHVEGVLAPIREEVLAELPRPHTAAHDVLVRAGEAAIKNGEVAALLLNGGMATRFGGVAKGAARAFRDESFLGLRMKQIRGVADALKTRVPVVLMSSFATENATREHLEARGDFGFDRDDVLACVQGISIRLTESGEVFRGADKKPSFYAPGHGDLPWAVSISGVKERLARRGVKTLFVSNVDNLGCTLDPAIIGAHLAGGKAMTAELVSREPQDVGGAPLYLDGRLQLIEGFRWPPSFKSDAVLGFNTNTFCFSLEALDPALPLGFYPVAKKVDGMACVQFERIVGEVSKFLPCHYLLVPRDLRGGRFLPVKTPEDLKALEPVLEARYG